MARLPAAPGAYGQPPVPPADESKQRTPGVEPGRDVGEGRPAGVVEVVGDPLQRQAGLDGQPGECRDLARHADPDRVAEADLVHAEVEESERDVDGPGRSTRPVYGHPKAVET